MALLCAKYAATLSLKSIYKMMMTSASVYRCRREEFKTFPPRCRLVVSTGGVECAQEDAKKLLGQGRPGV